MMMALPFRSKVISGRQLKMKRPRLLLLTLCMAIAVAIVLQGLSRTAADGSLPTITNYYSPCANNTAGTVSTFHGVNRDGKPPLDHSRRTYDFHCAKQQLYSPT